jgi:hypothetical protein
MATTLIVLSMSCDFATEIAIIEEFQFIRAPTYTTWWNAALTATAGHHSGMSIVSLYEERMNGRRRDEDQDQQPDVPPDKLHLIVMLS